MVLRVALDFDNVIADTSSMWLDKVYEHFPELLKERANRLTIEHIVEYDVDKILAKYYRKKLKPCQTWGCFMLCWEDYQNLKPIDENARFYVESMILGKQWDVTIYTAAGKEIVKDWLSHHKFNPGIINIKYVKPGESKLDKLKEFDVLVDDNMAHIQTFIDNEQAAIIYDRPWNRQVGLSTGDVPRVYNFADLYTKLSIMEQDVGL